MTWDDEFFYPHTVSIRDRLGTGGMGPRHGEARSSPAEVKDIRRLVRGADGAETVSSSQVIVPLDPTVSEGSLVTVWPGTGNQREAKVITVGRDDNTDDPELDAFQVLYLT